jgi:flagellar hook-associated protein 2
MTTSISNSSISSTSSTNSTTNTTSNTVTGGPDSIGYTNDQSSSHVSGLASGIDVDSMVKKMMSAASLPLVQMEQQKQLIEWQQEDYRTMNSTLLDLQTQTFNMSLQGSYLSKQAISSDDTKITAIAGATAVNTAYTISQATVASAATNHSQTAFTSSSTYDGSQSFWDARNDFNTPISWTTQPVTGESVSGSGTSYQLANGYIDGTPTLKDGSTQLSVTTDQSAFNASGSTYNAYVDPTTGQVTLKNPPTSGSLTATYNVDKSINFSISTYDTSGNETAQNFSFAPTDNLNTMISQINNSNLGITAFYSSYSQMVSFSRNQTGDLNKNGNEIVFSGDNSNFLTNTLGLNKETGGTDGTLTLNGVTISSHTNTFTMNGVTYNLTAPINSDVTVNVSTDTQSVLNNIESWVNKYNSAIATINSKISEKRNLDYPPLTNVQASQMTQTQIQQWTVMARSGMLSNDNILPSSLSKMRQDIYNPVTSSSGTSETYTQLSQIGITTSSNYQDNGKLVINEDQLKQAIATDPQSVMDLFTKQSTDYNQQGIMQRLNTTLTNTMNQITQRAGNDNSVYNQYDLGLQLNDYDTRISDETKRLDALQTRYYNQFSAMEQAISSSNQQAAYIQNNMG